MTTQIAPTLTAAEHQAQQNWQANLPALTGTQPHLADAIHDLALDLQWIYARDGCLTALDSLGQWLAKCSLPRRASQQMLRTMQAAGHACFMFPLHPVQLEIALTILPPNLAVHGILPDLSALAIALHCCDFSAAIRSHRLFFSPGPNWSEELAHTLREYPGLPLPQNLIRTITIKADQTPTLVAMGQRVFNQLTEERNRLRSEILASSPAPRRSPPRICLLAPSRFRLWDDAATILSDMLTRPLPGATPFSAESCTRLDPDNPASSSHLALTLACRDCDAIITANCTRADFPDTIPNHIPVLSWLTTPHIPPFTSAMANDALLLADATWVQRAQSAGWPASRLAHAAWPGNLTPTLPPSAPCLGIIADTTDIAKPPQSLDLSSHGLLWDLIVDEMRRDPFLLNGDIHQYLASRMRRLSIDEHGFDRRLFLEGLILPAYQQGLARTLLQAGLPLRLFGQTWPTLPEFAPHVQRPIHSRTELLTAAAGTSALVHVWPSTQAHPIEALSRPVLRAYTLSRTSLIQSARRLLTYPTAAPAPANPLTPALLASFLPH